jgi:hypothetical protein
MGVDFDKGLTDLTTGIWRDAVQVYAPGAGLSPVLAAWGMGMPRGIVVTSTFSTVTSSFPAATGSFAALTGSFPATTGYFEALTGSFRAVDRELAQEPPVTLKRVFKLPNKLPGIRLLPEPELAAMARSAPVMAGLNALARWLGQDSRLVTRNNNLTEDDAADASRRLGIEPVPLSYLWEYALTSGWFELEDSADRRRTSAVTGPTARRWADGDDLGALHVWAAVFAAVAARVLAVMADADPAAARKLDFRGQGAALAVMLFVTRRAGMTTRDAEDLVRDSAIGDRPAGRRKRAWNAWVQKHGDPAHHLLAELAAVGAVVPPRHSRGTVELTPLALWALREQFALDKISVRVLPPPSPRMSGADLVALSDTVGEAEFNAVFAAWISGRDLDRTVRELLMFAGSSAPRERVTAVEIARRVGVPGLLAWRDAMKRPELRGYARITLGLFAAHLPESSLPLVLEPDPADTAWLATDLLATACAADEPDPDGVAAEFAEAVPKGEEASILALMAQSAHPDVARVLDVLGNCHPDRRVAKDARKAARAFAANRHPARRPRIPSWTSAT